MFLNDKKTERTWFLVASLEAQASLGTGPPLRLAALFLPRPLPLAPGQRQAPVLKQPFPTVSLLDSAKGVFAHRCGNKSHNQGFLGVIE